MYKRILVPLDGSPRAEKILNHVEEMALRFKAQVIFLQVVNPFVPIMDSYTDLLEQSLNEIKRQVEKSKSYLSAWRGNFRKKGIHSRKIVEQGPVVDTILKIAQQEEVDLIAMASHGRSGLSRVFYGSVAVGILHRVDRPLLLIRVLESD
ncbi:MAG: universal stress protein [Desulfobacterales bacterium]|nr:universal stress protein [Desulfobacterales bacterium]